MGRTSTATATTKSTALATAIASSSSPSPVARLPTTSAPPSPPLSLPLPPATTPPPRGAGAARSQPPQAAAMGGGRPYVEVSAAGAGNRTSPLLLPSNYTLLEGQQRPDSIVDHVSNNFTLPEPWDNNHASTNSMAIMECQPDDLYGCTTSKRIKNLPFCGSLFTPICQEDLKPAMGMKFDSLIEVKRFYKSYAHHVSFSVRRGSQKNHNGEVLWKRYFCSKEGFRLEKAQNASIGTEKSDESKRRHSRKITRYGCEAMVALKRIEDGKYMIAKFDETHTHELVTLTKQQFIRSNREVSDKVKNVLFTCQKESIGTSTTFRLLHADAGGFENIGCMKRDLQNYQRDLKAYIKSSDSQIFLDNLRRKKLVEPTFFYESVVDDKDRLVNIFWVESTYRKNYVLFGDVVSFDSTYSTNQYNNNNKAFYLKLVGVG